MRYNSAPTGRAEAGRGGGAEGVEEPPPVDVVVARVACPRLLVLRTMHAHASVTRVGPRRMSRHIGRVVYHTPMVGHDDVPTTRTGHALETRRRLHVGLRSRTRRESDGRVGSPRGVPDPLPLPIIFRVPGEDMDYRVAIGIIISNPITSHHSTAPPDPSTPRIRAVARRRDGPSSSRLPEEIDLTIW